MTRLTQEERRARREKIAQFAHRHGAAKAVEKFEVGRTLVTTACQEFGLVPKQVAPSRTFDKSRLRLIAALIRGDVPYGELAERHGISRQAVDQFAQKCADAGIPLAGWDVLD